MPIESKTGGKVSYIKNKEAMCLSEKQTNYIYKKAEEGKIININTMKNEIEQDLDREDDNPYKSDFEQCVQRHRQNTSDGRLIYIQ